MSHYNIVEADPIDLGEETPQEEVHDDDDPEEDILKPNEEDPKEEVLEPEIELPTLVQRVMEELTMEKEANEEHAVEEE